MAPDTPECFTLAASARCTRQDQTRFGGSVERSFRSARLRESAPAPENSFRTVGRRFKRRGSCAPVRHKLGRRVPRAILLGSDWLFAPGRHGDSQATGAEGPIQTF